MVRIAAVALLAFAASALAAPHARRDANETIVDFDGKPLAEAKQKEFLDLEQQGNKKFDELLASYTNKQQGIEDELNAIGEKQRVILGFPEEGEEGAAK
ncbi:hypothetical protein MY4038_001188 [Beauveria bassiana]